MPRNCENCATSSTPVWRKGLHPTTWLCNACGLRRKRRLHQIYHDDLVSSESNLDLNKPLFKAKNMLPFMIPPVQLPKRHASVFVQFAKIWRPVLQENRPDIDFGKTSTELSKLWNTLSEQEKSPYHYLSRKSAQSERCKALLSKVTLFMKELLEYPGVSLIPSDSLLTCCLKDIPNRTCNTGHAQSSASFSYPDGTNCSEELFILDIRKKTKFTDNYYLHYIPT